MFGKDKSKKAGEEQPSEEAKRSSEFASKLIGQLLSSAFAMGAATAEAKAAQNRPLTFEDAVSDLVNLELTKRAVEKEVARLGFDLGKVRRAASLHVEVSEFDGALLNPHG